MKLRKMVENIEKALMAIDCVLLVILTLIVTLQVIARKMNISMAGTEEVARYSYVIFAFLAWPVAAMNGTDIRITFIFDKFPAKIRKIGSVITSVLMAVYAVFCFYSMTVIIKFNDGVVGASNRWLVMNWVYTIVLVGITLTILFNVFRAVLLATEAIVYVPEIELNEQLIAESTANFNN